MRARDWEQERIPLFAGVELSYTDIVSDSFSHRHEALAHIIQINYCRAKHCPPPHHAGGAISLYSKYNLLSSLSAFAQTESLFAHLAGNADHFLGHEVDGCALHTGGLAGSIFHQVGAVGAVHFDLIGFCKRNAPLKTRDRSFEGGFSEANK